MFLPTARLPGCSIFALLTFPRIRMAGYESLLTVTEEKRLWVDDGFARLSKALGRGRMLKAKVILPTSDFFPDPYDGSDDAIEDFFFRICDYMGVEYDRVELEIVHNPYEQEEETKEEPEKSSTGASHDVEQETDESEPREQRKTIVRWRSESCLVEACEDDPSRFIVTVFWIDFDNTLQLAARLTHDLGHIILVG